MEQALSLAAGLTAELAEKDYVVDLFVAGDDVHHVQAGRAITQMENILELLACVEPADTLDVGALESVLLPEASRLSTIVFVMMMWNPPRLELIQRLRNEGVAIRVICMKKGWYPKGLDPAEVIDLQRATDSGASLSMMKMSFFKPRTV